MNKQLTVKEIPADTIIEMTPALYQEFCIGGCVPHCHFTHHPIKMGEMFKLSTITEHLDYEGNLRYGMDKTHQVMLAEKTDVKAYFKYHENRIKDVAAMRAKDKADGRTGCFVINGVIVP